MAAKYGALTAEALAAASGSRVKADDDVETSSVATDASWTRQAAKLASGGGVKLAPPANMVGLTDMTVGATLVAKDADLDDPVEALEETLEGRGAAATAVLQLSKAPGVSLRKILDEVDPSLSPNTVVVWMFNSGGERNETNATERACRPLTLLRPNKDLIILPMGSTIVQDLWAWACDTLGYELWQAIWVPFDFEGLPWSKPKRYKMYKLVIHALQTMPLVTASGSGGAGGAGGAGAGERPEVILVPFHKPKAMLDMCEAAGIKVFGDLAEGLIRKDMLHPRPDPELKEKSPLPNTLLHPVSREPLPIRVPRGFTCFNKDELRWGFEAMHAAGCRIVVKPSWESAGHGIDLNFTREKMEEYHWKESLGPVGLEEYIDADKKSDGSLLLPVIHCLARSQFGDIVEQLITGTTSYNGTASPCRVEDTTRGKVAAAITLLADTLDFQGFWGVDFLLVKGEPILIDLNTGRPNGGHVPKIFAARFAPGKPFYFFKVRETPAGTRIATIYKRLIEKGLAFNKVTRRGLALMHCLPGGLSSFLAVGDDDADVDRIKALWMEHREYILGGPINDEEGEDY